MDLVPLAGEGRKDIRTFKKNLRFVFFFLRETPETQKKTRDRDRETYRKLHVVTHNIFCLKSR